jgi:hypothetical protein
MQVVKQKYLPYNTAHLNVCYFRQEVMTSLAIAYLKAWFFFYIHIVQLWFYSVSVGFTLEVPTVCPTRRWIIQIRFQIFIDQSLHSLVEASSFSYVTDTFTGYFYTLLHAGDNKDS